MYAGQRLGCGLLDAAAASSLLDVHRSALQAYTGVLFPWESFKGWGTEQQKAVELYRTYIGDPSDPAYRDEVQRTAQELIDQAAAAAEEGDGEAALERLINDRTLNER